VPPKLVSRHSPGYVIYRRLTYPTSNHCPSNIIHRPTHQPAAFNVLPRRMRANNTQYARHRERERYGTDWPNERPAATFLSPWAETEARSSGSGSRRRRAHDTCWQLQRAHGRRHNTRCQCRHVGLTDQTRTAATPTVTRPACSARPTRARIARRSISTGSQLTAISLDSVSDHHPASRRAVVSSRDSFSC